MRRSKIIVLILLIVSLLTGCYHRPAIKSRAPLAQYSEKQLDSIYFSSTHHYTYRYNFLVKSDSLVLYVQQPVEIVNNMNTDSFTVKHHTLLVVSDIHIVPQDSVDSVWIQLGTENARFGWIHESRLLPKVVPDDPISECISTFSDTHLLIFLIIIVIIGFAYLLRTILQKNAKIVHFNDIDSFYPTLLCLIVALAAALYASIQIFVPDVWQDFYYHPTLDPFRVPTLLSIFLILVWAMLIVGLAALDDIRKQLPFGDAILYSFGLAGVCAIDYILFSISTLYFVGYVLLAFYCYFAIRQYLKHDHVKYVCGNCGAELKHKGRCPHCGAMND